MKTIIITGMPRSGTSWLGQIINSHPKVLFRTEPLFAYRFKNIIDIRSPCEDVRKFTLDLVEVDDDFILQKDKLSSGFYPNFIKSQPKILAFKTTRHHELLHRYLTCLPNVHIMAIVRHPCGAINSWLNSDREFSKKGCNMWDDWRTGNCRKQETGEYWGFNDWLMSTQYFHKLSKLHNNFQLIRYTDLVSNTFSTVSNIFEKADLSMSEQTRDFLRHCHSRHDADPYSVFKDKQVLDSWKTSLDTTIANEILHEVKQKKLEYFLE